MINSYRRRGVGIVDRTLLMIPGLAMMVGPSATLQWVLEVKLRASVISSYSRVGIIIGNCARLRMTRLVIAVFGLSASLQRLLESELQALLINSYSEVGIVVGDYARLMIARFGPSAFL